MWRIFYGLKPLSLGYNIKALMLGSGSYDRALEKKIANNKLQNFIYFLGPKSHVELVEYYNQMHVFVLPTKLPESLALVGLEAMACGVPVIGSNIGGLKDYIKEGHNGLLFTPNDHISLAGHIKKFMNMDDAQYQEYRDNALYTASLYDSQLVAENLASKLKSIVLPHD